ncbi:MAG: LysE family translocator [Gammaproteobacteria bacterium]|nr:LysE family translocator [Gammaproteobacteria bacterium]
MLTFAAAVFLLIITPGPGVLSTAGVGAAFGSIAGYRYLVGLCIGTNLVSIAVITGLAGIMLSTPWLRQVLLGLSTAYLFYLAARIALSGSKISFIEAQKSPGVVNGIALQIINPKAYVVNTTLFSGFAFANYGYIAETGIKLLIMNAVWIPIHLLWLAAGVMLKRLSLPDRTQRLINLVMAASLIAVVVLALRGL